MVDKIENIADQICLYDLLAVCECFGFDKENIYKIEELQGGLINKTYKITTRYDYQIIVQRLHPIFKPSVNVDFSAISNELNRNGFLAPRLIKSIYNGQLGFYFKGYFWRTMSYIDGVIGEIGSDQIMSAGKLLSKFHNILANFKYRFKHRLPGFHDTKLKITNLKYALARYAGTKECEDMAYEAEFVISEYEKLSSYFVKERKLPKRIIHGDPKFNNVLFDARDFQTSAIAFLDFDTLGRHPVVYDIADASRSWCAKRYELSSHYSFDSALFRMLIRGYIASSPQFLTAPEIDAIPDAIKKMMLELSARFLADALEKKYFKLDSSKYNNLYEQNTVKAQQQISLYKSYMSKQDEVRDIVSLFYK